MLTQPSIVINLLHWETFSVQQGFKSKHINKLLEDSLETVKLPQTTAMSNQSCYFHACHLRGNQIIRILKRNFRCLYFLVRIFRDLGQNEALRCLMRGVIRAAGKLGSYKSPLIVVLKRRGLPPPSSYFSLPGRCLFASRQLKHRLCLASFGKDQRWNSENNLGAACLDTKYTQPGQPLRSNRSPSGSAQRHEVGARGKCKGEGVGEGPSRQKEG